MKGRLGCRAILMRSQALRLAEDLALGFLELLLDQRDFLLDADVEGVGFRMLLQLLKLVLQFDDRLFEVELMFHRLKLSQFQAVQATPIS